MIQVMISINSLVRNYNALAVMLLISLAASAPDEAYGRFGK